MAREVLGVCGYLLLVTALTRVDAHDCVVDHVKGLTVYQLNPPPDAHCSPNWQTDTKPLANDKDIDDTLVSETSKGNLRERIILKSCMPKVFCSLDCEDPSGEMTRHDITCTTTCPVTQPAPERVVNGSSGETGTGGPPCGVLPLPARISVGVLIALFILTAVALVVFFGYIRKFRCFQGHCYTEPNNVGLNEV